MNPPSLSLFLLPILLAGGTTFAVLTLAKPEPAEAAPPAAAPAPDPALVQRIEDGFARLEQRLAAFETRLDGVEQQAARIAIESRRMPPASREPEGVPDEVVPAPAAAASEPKDDAAALAPFLAELSKPDLSDDQWTEIWGRIGKAGLLDAALAHYEQAVKADPRNPDKQVALGGAYLAKLFTVGSGPEAGTWATRADAAFDKALEVDPNHWDARFSKATSLAFWPPVLGKGPEAIRHFETLIQQQESKGYDEPKYAQSYVFLANMLEQSGEKEKANEVRTRGARRFPNHKELNRK
jgi:tetratricopeptide (TPR) repeat protein